MLLGNLIVFLVVIVVVCVVDLSSFSLDESTERLLYYDAEGTARKGENSEGSSDLQTDGESENLSSTEETMVSGAAVDEDSIIEDAMSEIDEMLSETELESPTESVPTVNWELQPGIVLGTQPEKMAGQPDDVRSASLQQENGDMNYAGAAKQKRTRKRAVIRIPQEKGEIPEENTQKRAIHPVDTKKRILVSSLDDSLGMSTDFDDDFKDLSDLIREVHDGGSPS